MQDPQPPSTPRPASPALLLGALLIALAPAFGGCVMPEGGDSSSEAREPSRCGACGGSGQTKDHNRGVMETCHYCNGAGVW